MDSIQLEMMRVLCNDASSNAWMGGREIASRMKPPLEIAHLFDNALNRLWQMGYVEGETDQAPDWNRLARATAHGFDAYFNAIKNGVQREKPANTTVLTEVNVPSPGNWILGKNDILKVLNQTEEKWNWILKLSKESGGPIGTQEGGMSVADRDKLIIWFTSALERYGQQDERENDKKSSVAITYQHGKNGVVAPEINGSVKKRKKK